MESAADWPPPTARVPRKPEVAQFCAAPRPNFTPALTDGPLVINDTGIIRQAAIAGVGLAYLPEASVAEHLSSGTLVRVLERWCEPFPGFFLYHPSRKQTPPGLRALITFFTETKCW